MKINTEDYLHNIDAYFKEKSQKDTYMIYVMTFGVIFSFAYLLFWDSSFEAFEQKNSEIRTLSEKISMDNLYMQHNPESKIVKLDQEIQETQKALVDFKDKNRYIKSKIEAISFLIYDERTWGEYLDSISNNAREYKVKVNEFSNTLVEHQNSFGHVLDLSVKTTGGYLNTLKFINALEQSNLVVDIHTMNISAKDELETDLNISVWGITY
ncbi:MAG: hypothetical protein IE916_00745 [Epsilonproteobacteria bacterium]|nr:hypothetical protein [Campylobacterota bacterium]